MNFISAIFRRPEPLPHVVMDMPMRSTDGQFTASPKTIAHRSRASSIRCQLAVYKATTTPEQRMADANEFFSRSAEKRGTR